jgi:hypothetical protein
MSTLTQLIIAALIALGLLTSSAVFDNLSASEQAEMTEIVIEDINGN